MVAGATAWQRGERGTKSAELMLELAPDLTEEDVSQTSDTARDRLTPTAPIGAAFSGTEGAE